MSQINAKDLDYSNKTREFSGSGHSLIEEKYNMIPEQTRRLTERFFGIDVDPLERALVMHEDAETIAADLAGLDA